MRILELREYVKLLQRNGLIDGLSINEGELNADVTKISYNSMDIQEGTLFLCKGLAFKESYLKSALEKGAFCFIYGPEFTPEDEYDCTWIKVNDTRKAMAVIACAFYDNCWDKLKMIGITGTKGKTTVAYYTRAIIEKALEERIGFLSSIVTYDGEREEEATLTTPETFELHKLFQNMVDYNVKANLMEVSSQALKYHRTYGITYDIACFTNISNDHISESEHPDLEDYFKAKLILMDQCKVAIINNDLPTEFIDRIVERAKASSVCEKIILYGTRDDSDVKAIDMVSSMRGIEFTMVTDEGTEFIKIPMIGDFNISNALAAAAICKAMGIAMNMVPGALENIFVPGRVNVFYNEKRDVTGIVDFAHNTLSCEALRDALLALRPDAKYTQIFGGTEAKGLNRRKDVADVAQTYCYRVILTEEDPGNEPVVDICNEIAGYITNPDVEIKIIELREEAVKYAVETAQPGEIVVITGKGADTTIKRGNVACPVKSDVELMDEYVNGLE